MRPLHLAALAALSLLSPPFAADAATLTVTTTLDDNIADGECSLREAVMAASSNQVVSDCPAGEAWPVVDLIAFDIPGAGVQTITLGSQLVPMEAVTIDGYTQPGASPNTNATGALNATLRIALVGDCGGCIAFSLVAHGGPGGVYTFRGLSISGVHAAVLMGAQGTDPSPQIVVEGNYLGTDAGGLAAPSPTNIGVQMLHYPQVRIGGPLPAQRNLLAGFAQHAIVSFIGTQGTVIQGNLIGTDRTGLVALPIGSDAIYYRIGGGTDHLAIGGSAPGEGNVIAGAGGRGIAIDVTGNDVPPELAGDDVRVQGNLVGVGVDGITPLGNGGGAAGLNNTRSGVRYASLANSSGMARIGGENPGEANVIAYSTGPGIEFSGSAGGVTARAVGNVLFGNAIGIDLSGSAPDGRTPNDPGDADAGANRGQNHPELFDRRFTPPAARAPQGASGVLEIDYLVDSDPANSDYPLRIDFYRALGGEAFEHLGSDTYTAAEAGVMVTATLAADQRPPTLVATATDAAGRTSELAPAFPVGIFADGFEDAP